MNIEKIIPSKFDANVRKQTLSIDNLAAWPDEAHARVYAYGLQRILNDACGAVPTKNEDGTERDPATVAAECLELAKKVADNLANGIIRAAAIRTGDPVKALALELAEKAVANLLRSQGKKPAEYDTRASARTLVESNPKWLADAKTAIDAANAIEVDIDLGSIAKAKPKAAKAAPAK